MPPADSYDLGVVRALGLITLEFSRLEGTALDLLATLTSPDQRAGAIAVSGQNLSTVLERIRAMLDQRLKPGALRTTLESWVSDVASVTEERNGVVHGRWLASAVTLKVHVKKGRLKHQFVERSSEDLLRLGRRIWALHTGGMHLGIDLAVSGFAKVVNVSVSSEGDTISEHVLPASEFPVEGKMLGRPDPPPVWPGDL